MTHLLGPNERIPLFKKLSFWHYVLCHHVSEITVTILRSTHGSPLRLILDIHSHSSQHTLRYLFSIFVLLWRKLKDEKKQNIICLSNFHYFHYHLHPSYIFSTRSALSITFMLVKIRVSQ